MLGVENILDHTRMPSATISQTVSLSHILLRSKWQRCVESPQQINLDAAHVLIFQNFVYRRRINVHCIKYNFTCFTEMSIPNRSSYSFEFKLPTYLGQWNNTYQRIRQITGKVFFKQLANIIEDYYPLSVCCLQLSICEFQCTYSTIKKLNSSGLRMSYVWS